MVDPRVETFEKSHRVLERQTWKAALRSFWLRESIGNTGSQNQVVLKSGIDENLLSHAWPVGALSQ